MHTRTHTHNTHNTHTPVHLHIYQLLDHFVLQAVQEFQRNVPSPESGWKEKGPKNGLLNNLILSNLTPTLSSLWPPSHCPPGLSARHPFTGAPIPVYAADYVNDWDTQAVMGNYKYVITHSENLIDGLGIRLTI